MQSSLASLLLIICPKKVIYAFHPGGPGPKNLNDIYDSFKEADAFHATRFEWLYIKPGQDNFVKNLRKQGYSCGIALNTILPDDPCSYTFETGRIIDSNGAKVTGPWMRKWVSM